MSRKRYTEKFKVETVKQVTDRDYSIAEVAERLGVTAKSLYNWVKRYGEQSPEDVERATAIKPRLHALRLNCVG